ncbi:hypothetical protein BDF14DRAFT_1758282 [Spinellus fusiger]|nr:hypothetical protein BDF14DRAFT_1758282 [Spinellus fusiger]
MSVHVWETDSHSPSPRISLPSSFRVESVSSPGSPTEAPSQSPLPLISDLPTHQHEHHPGQWTVTDPPETSASTEMIPESSVPVSTEFLPSTRWTFHSLFTCAVHFIFRNNNLPLIIHLLYHLGAARVLLKSPVTAVRRYTASSQWNNDHALALTADQFRTIGIMHLALGILAGLTLKERRIASEHSALLVFTMASAGQLWAHAKAYLAHPGHYTVRAVQEIGVLDSLLLAVGSVALVKTVKRTGHIL